MQKAPLTDSGQADVFPTRQMVEAATLVLVNSGMLTPVTEAKARVLAEEMLEAALAIRGSGPETT
jgi:hypothetical protein